MTLLEATDLVYLMGGTVEYIKPEHGKSMVMLARVPGWTFGDRYLGDYDTPGWMITRRRYRLPGQLIGFEQRVEYTRDPVPGFIEQRCAQALLDVVRLAQGLQKRGRGDIRHCHYLLRRTRMEYAERCGFISRFGNPDLELRMLNWYGNPAPNRDSGDISFRGFEKGSLWPIPWVEAPAYNVRLPDPAEMRETYFVGA